ncbi:MAG: hypothetical protein Q7S76_04275 [bacterium]|nr:hypothetical protein [bacterium]
MRCPLGDGQLSVHRHTDYTGFSTTYSICSKCHGFWLSAFDANYIPLEEFALPRKDVAFSIEKTLSCPVCQDGLVSARGENIPPSVSAWMCPLHHGYFFPTTELRKFKDAQNTKISYFKLWNLPLPSLSSVLLTSITITILSLGLLLTYLEVFNRQTTQSQAHTVVTSHQVFVTPTRHVTIAATTQFSTNLTLTINPNIRLETEMRTTDGISHSLTVFDVPAGTYEYSFSYSIDDTTTSTPRYRFTVGGK